MSKPNYDELIAAKKQKALRDQLLIDLASTVKVTKKESDNFWMIDGMQVKKENASFFGVLETSAVSKKTVKKVFLNKELNSIEHQFGSEMARILSAKRYVIRRPVLVKKDAQVHGAVKWSEAIAQPNANFLKGIEVVVEKDNPDFRKKYARLCGVLHVLGERDHSARNFFIDYGQKKPVKIDNSFLVNDIFARQYQQADASGVAPHLTRLRIYGCAQSQQMILNRFAGGNFDNKFFTDLYQEAHETAGRLARTDLLDIDFEKYNQIFNTAFSSGINDEVLEKIKTHILKPGNENIKEEFIEFMQGVQDAIDLSKDKEFLDKYVQKYHDEIGEDAFKIAQVTRGFLEENAKFMENEQLAGFLQFYRQLGQEKVRRKLPPTPSASRQSSAAQLAVSPNTEKSSASNPSSEEPLKPDPNPSGSRVRRMLPQIKGKVPVSST